jgi:hypothetical protein
LDAEGAEAVSRDGGDDRRGAEQVPVAAELEEGWAWSRRDADPRGRRSVEAELEVEFRAAEVEEAARPGGARAIDLGFEGIPVGSIGAQRGAPGSIEFRLEPR